jgi:hypothetical protein
MFHSSAKSSGREKRKMFSFPLIACSMINCKTNGKCQGEENCAKSFSVFSLPLDSLPVLDAHNGGKKEENVFLSNQTHLLLLLLRFSFLGRFQIIP